MTYDKDASNQYFDAAVRTIREWVDEVQRDLRERPEEIDETDRNGMKAIFTYCEHMSSEVNKFCEVSELATDDIGRVILMMSGMGGWLIQGTDNEMTATILMNMFSLVGEHLITDGTAKSILDGLDLGE